MRQGLLLAFVLHVVSTSNGLSLGPTAHQRSSYRNRNQRHVLDRNLNALQQQQGYPSMNMCQYETYEDSTALAGDVFFRYTLSDDTDCKSACLLQTDFYCAAALLRSSTCYLTGFRMRRDYWSTHYVRACNDTSNMACYKPMPGWSVAHSKDFSIPWFLNGREPRFFFCMALCNERIDCVGFDIKDHGQRPMCHLSQLVPLDARLRFDVHLRRC